MAEVTLHAEIREEKGKQAAKEIKRKGLVPAVLYGKGENSMILTIGAKEILELLHASGRNTIVDIVIGSGKKKQKTFIYDIQHDPMTGNIIHVDFKHISMKEEIHVSVPVHLEGIPDGVKNDAGIVEHTMHTLDIKCLPQDIPDNIKIDISLLKIGDAIHVRDIPQENFEFISEPDRTIVHVIAPKVVLAEEEEGAAEELEEEMEETAEPEVIGKKEEE